MSPRTPMAGPKSQGEMFSHSRISTYESCPLKFKFRYIDKVKVDVSETIEQFMGKKVHEALEHLYKSLQMGKNPSIEEILSFYSDKWMEGIEEIKEKGSEILVAKEGEGLSIETYRSLGERCLSDYYSAHSPFKNDGTTIGIETKVIALLPGGERILGFIDRLSSQGAGVYEIHDYKTNSRLKTQSELDSDRQLALYSLAIKQQYPDAKKVSLVWHFLAFGKEMRSERTDRELKELGKSTAELVRKIRAEKDFPAKESKLCDYCEYQRICPKRKHLFESGEKEKRPVVDGAVLADAYARLKEQAKSLDEETEKVRAALVEFAKESGTERIFGKDYSVNIRTEVLESLPKGEEERKRLILSLKKGGLWENVSDINIFALRKLIREGKIEEGVLSKLPLGKEERKTLTVSRRKNY